MNFILTMWYVNTIRNSNRIIVIHHFILTMWYVNNLEKTANKGFNALFYIN